MEPTAKTERQKYIEKIEGELSKAAKAKRFVGSEDGQYVIDYMKQLTSDLVNQITNRRCEELEYVEKRGQIAILRKLTQVLETQANEAVMIQLREQLNLAQSEE